MGAMYRVCSLLLSPNFVVRLATGNNFYLRLIELFRKYMRLWVLTINIYVQAALAIQILPLNLTVEMQELKY